MKTLAQIGEQLQGYDPQALRADQVLAFLAELAEPVTGTQHVPLFDALGRVLADDLISPLDVPPHDNSASNGHDRLAPERIGCDLLPHRTRSTEPRQKTTG